MQKLIEHIDAIARKVQRDVLYIGFNKGVEKDYSDDHSSVQSHIAHKTQLH